MSKKEPKIYTQKEWLNRGKELFGDDFMDWRFVCPVCGNIQTILDFKKINVEPNGVFYFSCIGRYIKDSDGDIFNGKEPCNYTSGGLLTLNDVFVIDPEGEKVPVFAFEGDE